jgi:hypothetical protein
MTTQRQAKQGGEIGKNGEVYKGGQFIANTDHAKGQYKKAPKLRKQQVLPWVWEVQPTPDHRAICSMVGGVWAKYNHDTGKLENFLPNTPADILEIAEAFNNGEKWCIYNQETKRIEKIN